MSHTTPEDFYIRGIDVDVCKVCGMPNDHMTNCVVPIIEAREKLARTKRDEDKNERSDR